MNWLPPLLKSAVAFAEAQHPRAADGRFTDGNSGGSARLQTQQERWKSLAHLSRTKTNHDSGEVTEYRGTMARRVSGPTVDMSAPPLEDSSQNRPIIAPAPPQRRSLERMSSWHSRANRVPHGFTGKHDVELPIGSFTRAELTLHQPKALSREQHQALLGHLTQVIHGERQATIEAGQEPKKRGKLKGRVLIPEGTERRTMHRAYNHAAMIALHEYGVGKYDFAMDDHLKAELTPLVPFIHFAKRRMLNTMLDRQKGGWRPYRQEFGETFADGRKDKLTGETRLRKPLVGQLIKEALAFAPGGAALAKFDEAERATDILAGLNRRTTARLGAGHG